MSGLCLEGRASRVGIEKRCFVLSKQTGCCGGGCSGAKAHLILVAEQTSRRCCRAKSVGAGAREESTTGAGQTCGATKELLLLLLRSLSIFAVVFEAELLQRFRFILAHAGDALQMNRDGGVVCLSTLDHRIGGGRCHELDRSARRCLANGTAKSGRGAHAEAIVVAEQRARLLSGGRVAKK